jgi:CRP-like cAMP-binding protein
MNKIIEQKSDVSELRKIQLFNSLSNDEIQEIVSAKHNEIITYGVKEIIIKESEVGDCMYVILDGSVEVLIRGESQDISLAILRAGDFFGESALFDPQQSGRRNATVKSLEHAKVFKIYKDYVSLKVSEDWVGNAYSTLSLNTKRPKSDNTTQLSGSIEEDNIANLFSEIDLFSSLDKNELKTIQRNTKIISYQDSEFILKEGDAGDCLYVVLDGTVDIVLCDDDGAISTLGTHERGGYFGEESLLPHRVGSRTACAKACGITKLIRVPKVYFRLVINRDSSLMNSLIELSKQHEVIRKKIRNNKS